MLALEYKKLAYTSHLVQFSKQEHKSPQMLALNFRGRVPVLKDGDYVVFESLAVLYYLDLKYPQPPLFGRSPEEAGIIMRVICEFQAYVEEHLNRIVDAFFLPSRHRNLDELAKSEWVVGDSFSAADIVLFPALQTLLRALAKPDARELSARFLPLEINYPALARWCGRVEKLPGYERTYPPHWRA